MTENELLLNAGESIEKNRKGNFELTVTTRFGYPVKQKNILIKQRTHDFLFGAGLGGLGVPSVTNIVQETFNFGTLMLFWKLIETQKGLYDLSYQHAVADWCKQKNITLKGHPIFWG